MKGSFSNALGFFFKLYQQRTLVVVGLLILSGFAEAVGVASFLPLLQIIIEGKGGLPSDSTVGNLFLSVGVPPTFLVIAGLIVLAMSLKAFFLWTAMKYVSATVVKVADDLRMRFLEAILHANWTYFVTHTLGSSLNTIATQTFQASTAFVSATRFMAALIQFLIYACGAFFVSWMVFAGGTLIGSLIVFTLWSLVRIARRAGQRQTEIARRLLEQLADMLQGIKPLRAMALEKKFLVMMTHQSQGLQQAQADQLTSSQSMRIFNEPLMMIAGVIGLYLAVTYGNLESSSLILMGVLFMRILTSMNAAQAEYQRLVSQESALWALMEQIEKAEKQRQAWPGVDSLSDNSNNIRLDNVSFHYVPEKPLLQSVSIDLPPNKLVALVGASGSGKTSILDLICGLHRPTEGRIFAGATPIESINLTQWRHSIGFVPQEVFLFNDSILENIRMGREGISEDDVMTAVIAAGAKDFVQALPAGLHSPVGENGRMLSGGQRQRIAIARAIIGNPKFLLMDEATSALDSTTEENLLKTLKDLSRSVTILFVSHNRAILSYADIIYEIAHGQIIQKES